MMTLSARWMIVVLALMLAAPTVGCRQNQEEKASENGFEVEIDTGKTNVKIEGSRNPDENGADVDVDVEHHPESGDTAPN